MQDVNLALFVMNHMLIYSVIEVLSIIEVLSLSVHCVYTYKVYMYICVSKLSLFFNLD